MGYQYLLVVGCKAHVANGLSCEIVLQGLQLLIYTRVVFERQNVRFHLQVVAESRLVDEFGNSPLEWSTVWHVKMKGGISQQVGKTRQLMIGTSNRDLLKGMGLLSRVADATISPM